MSRVDRGFGQLEVLQVEVVAGRAVVLFSCTAEHATDFRRDQSGGVWAVEAPSCTGPFRIEDAFPLTDDRLYVGRLLRRREDGEWFFFAFHHLDDEGRFVGGVSDPLPVRWQGDRLIVGEAGAQTRTLEG